MNGLIEIVRTTVGVKGTDSLLTQLKERRIIQLRVRRLGKSPCLKDTSQSGDLVGRDECSLLASRHPLLSSVEHFNAKSLLV